MLVDQTDGEVFVPLNSLTSDQTCFMEVCPSDHVMSYQGSCDPRLSTVYSVRKVLLGLSMASVLITHKTWSSGRLSLVTSLMELNSS